VDQKFRSAGGKISGITLILCGLIIIPLTLLVLFSWPSKINWIIWIFIPAAMWMIYAGFKTIKIAKLEINEAEKKQLLIKNEIGTLEKQAEHHSDSKKIVLAHWKYPAKDWRFFIKMEKKNIGFTTKTTG